MFNSPYDENLIQQLGLSKTELVASPEKELAKLRMLLPLAKFLQFLHPKIDENEAIAKYTEYKDLYSRNAALNYFLDRKADDW